jgi:hypothetical protein
MKVASFEAIARALQEVSVRYVVSGGLAVNAHGYLRLIKNVDLIAQFDPLSVRRALGYRPAIPVAAEQCADPAQREAWVREKAMQVFQLRRDQHRETPIDIFLAEPFAFDPEYDAALIKPLRDDLPAHFVTIATLIRMKQLADRPQDRLDLEHLKPRLK